MCGILVASSGGVAHSAANRDSVLVPYESDVQDLFCELHEPRATGSLWHMRQWSLNLCKLLLLGDLRVDSSFTAGSISYHQVVRDEVLQSAQKP